MNIIVVLKLNEFITRQSLDYTPCFKGTSAAAPHVSGLAALMLSYHSINNGFDHNLAPEDVEEIIQTYATDVSGGKFSYPVGRDRFNGFGLINAGLCMKKIRSSLYTVYHTDIPTNTTTTKVGTNIKVSMIHRLNNVPPGSYWADKYKVTHTYQVTLPANTQVITGWKRLSSTNGLSPNMPIEGVPWESASYSVNGNVVTITAETYYYEILRNLLGNPVNRFIPNIPSKLKTAYTLHLFDPTGSSIEENINSYDLRVYPNPSSDQITFELIGFKNNDVSLSVFDLSGKMILSKNYSIDNNLLKSVVPINDLADGLYMVMLKTKDEVVVRKFIKN
jgi:hypothetical protein